MSALLPARIVDGDLTLQVWTELDLHPMEDLITDNLEHLRPWMAWAAREPIAPEQRRKLFARWERYRVAGNGAVYSIHVGAELVGGCAVHRRSELGGVEIGYWLGAKATGRGIATRTTRALTGTAFGLDGIEVVQISHERSNVRSGAVAERLGFALVETQTPGVTRWRVDRAGWSRASSRARRES